MHCVQQFLLDKRAVNSQPAEEQCEVMYIKLFMPTLRWKSPDCAVLLMSLTLAVRLVDNDVQIDVLGSHVAVKVVLAASAAAPVLVLVLALAAVFVGSPDTPPSPGL